MQKKISKLKTDQISYKNNYFLLNLFTIFVINYIKILKRILTLYKIKYLL
jgi:hypothetical protein